MGAKLEEIARRFSDAKPVGDGQWQACCPCHEDRRASLAIGEPNANGQILIYCHAGCKTANVLGAVGLAMADLMPEDRNGHDGRKQKGAIVFTYDYRDEQGVLLFQAVRMEPKDFRQRKPKLGGGWSWSVKGVRAVPYRLPELIAADPAQTVFVCEGEKDCDNLARLGLIATTNAGGAKKWRKAHAEHLKGRHVVILPDNDDPGREHGLLVARSLSGIAASVKILELPCLPAKGDVSDWLATGGTREQLQQLVSDAAGWKPEAAGEKQKPRGQSPDESQVYNAVIEHTEGSDGSEKKETVPLPMREVIERISAATKGWPRRVDNALFVDDEKSGVCWLRSPASLFGWLSSVVGVVDWHKVRGCVTKEETYNEEQRTAHRYDAVEDLPHEPPIDGHYYACREVEPGDGRTLRAFLDRFSPETEVDRDLIQAAMMTSFWGGPGGMRPCFVITTNDGPGVGKSTVAQTIGDVAGGLLSFDRSEQVGDIKTRLLSADAIAKRVALIDNVNSLKFSWGELEGLITAAVISGKRMYLGEGSRPNTITWFLTLNGANLSTDMAQRSVIIKVRRPTHSATWDEDTRKFIHDHRRELVADVIGALRAEPVRIEKFTRWAMWERAVLARLPEPTEAQRVIADRQGVVDAEQEENEIVESYFGERLNRLGYDTARDRVFLPSQLAAEWINRATNERLSVTGASRHLRRMIDERRFSSLAENSCKTYGRGFIWAGPESNGHGTFMDLNERLAKKLERQEVGS